MQSKKLPDEFLLEIRKFKENFTKHQLANDLTSEESVTKFVRHDARLAAIIDQLRLRQDLHLKVKSEEENKKKKSLALYYLNHTLLDMSVKLDEEIENAKSLLVKNIASTTTDDIIRTAERISVTTTNYMKQWTPAGEIPLPSRHWYRVTEDVVSQSKLYDDGQRTDLNSTFENTLENNLPEESEESDEEDEDIVDEEALDVVEVGNEEGDELDDEVEGVQESKTPPPNHLQSAMLFDSSQMGYALPDVTDDNDDDMAFFDSDESD
eukprot:TRINITY_DN9166_c0_g1_i2.p1 TRINITY_DN9166_c0_g1~~TRINITY_DN9166_c0_g1_i2.p1  ORF type:complete len:266 (-),score=86.24 TRINITY_DN9166_c0_g1_i2:32-829(-)